MAAWKTTYHRGLKADPGTPTAFGIVAVKKELAFNGHRGGMVLSTPLLGADFEQQARAFQTNANHQFNALFSKPLAVDGDIGPQTALFLWRKRAAEVEQRYSIPDHLLSKLKTLESSNDPGATGTVDPDDRGLCQINRRVWSSVTDVQAFDPAYALDWTARRLRVSYTALGDWDATIAAHNLPALADDWLAAGKPAKGGPFLDGVKRPAWEWLSAYVAAVGRQPV